MTTTHEEMQPQAAWPAVFYDGQSARQQPAEVHLRAHSLEIVPAGGAPFVWRFETIRQTAGRYRGEPVRLEPIQSRGPAIVVEAPGFAQALARGAGKQRFRAPETARRAWLHSLLTAAAALGLAGVLYTCFTYLAPKAIARMVPVRWEERLGADIFAELAPEGSRCTDPAAIQPVQHIVDRLAQAAWSGYRWRVAIVRSPEVNAFAAPGGYIVISQGLLELTRTPEELAGVLAHEMQHTIEHHAVEGLLAEFSSQGLLTIAGGSASASQMAARGASALARLRYSRQNESDADRLGFRLMDEAGVDPRGMLSLFERLPQELPAWAGGGYLSTHPPTRERLEQLRSLSPARAFYSPILGNASWQAVQKSCTAD